MRTLLCTIALLGFAVGAYASDKPVMMANPSGIQAPAPGILPPPQEIDPEDVLCGDLNYDRVNGLAAQRYIDGQLASWVLVNCEFDAEFEIQGFNWDAIDNTDGDWAGRDDFAIWDAVTVEQGCADDTNTIAAGSDLANERVSLNEVIFGRNAWAYHLTLPDPVTIQPGKYYFGVRAVVNGGQSFILTVPCNGRKQVYFQSIQFGFPCAVPGINAFGAEYCAAVEVLGKPAGPPVDKCVYQVNSVKIKKDLCGNPSCTDCPYALGDMICTHDCPPGCENSLNGTSACPSGSICKVKAGSIGCGPCPPGSKRCR